MSAFSLFSNLARQFEGYETHVYRDQAGIFSVGIGHTGPDVRPGAVWTPQQIDAAFINDSAKATHAVKAYSPMCDSWSPGTLAAAYDMAFNCGVGAYAGSTFRKNLEAGDLEAAKKSLLLWDKMHVDGKLVESAGLLRRRKAEADLIGV